MKRACSEILGVLLLDDSATSGAERNCTSVTSSDGVTDHNRPDAVRTVRFERTLSWF